MLRTSNIDNEKQYPRRGSKQSLKQSRKDKEKSNIKKKLSKQKEPLRWKEMRKNRIFDNKKKNSYIAAIQSITRS